MNELQQWASGRIALAHIEDARAALAELRANVIGVGGQAMDSAERIAEAVDALDLAEAAMRGLRPCS